ncbi:MAG TPA: hypothetical protein DCO93_03610 [Clostridiales bacterium]|nr:hypothetical protein [Clostridiales bacterium]
MHNLVKISASFILLMLLCGCGSAVKIDTIDKSYSTDTTSANVKIPQIKGLASHDLEDSVNDEFNTVTTELLNKFSESAKQTGEQSLFDMETTEHFNKNGLLSMVTDYEYFARKSHKSRVRIAKNIDTSACIELSLSDLFDGDSYIDALNKLLSDAVSKNPEKYSDIWAKPKISQNQGFYIDGDSLVIFYPPYELSYYERGFVEIPIALEEILTYLKPTYRELFAE